MDKIKFRSAFYNNSNHSFSHFSYWGRIDDKQNLSNDVFTSPSQCSGCHIMKDDAFTGFLDKNKKEIFTGDIVRYRCSNVSWTRIVSFQFGAFVSVIDKNKHDHFFNVLSDSELEIIGNIHENPNLIPYKSD